MKKIVILGCENSHADTFLAFIRDVEEFKNIEVLGIYSDETEAAEKLSKEFGVKVMSSYDEFAGQVDGVIITARHGDNHYKYAKPYIKYGVPMFIDKPVTVTEEDALNFMRECRDNGVRLTGGSSLKHVEEVQQLKKDVLNNVGGQTLGGFMRAPISLDNEYGGFFFYSEHLSAMVTEAFGTYPKSVKAIRNGDVVNVSFIYDNYVINSIYAELNYYYYVSRQSEQGFTQATFPIDEKSPCFYTEFSEFVRLLNGGEQKYSYKDFISPVFILNAIYRSLETGNEEIVKDYSL